MISLMTSLGDSGVILYEEIRCYSLVRVKVLKTVFIATNNYNSKFLLDCFTFFSDILLQ